MHTHFTHLFPSLTKYTYNTVNLADGPSKGGCLSIISWFRAVFYYLLCEQKKVNIVCCKGFKFKLQKRNVSVIIHSNIHSVRFCLFAIHSNFLGTDHVLSHGRTSSILGIDMVIIAKCNFFFLSKRELFMCRKLIVFS